MKNSVKLFGLLAVSLFIFSCSSDEQDADLARAIEMSENINLRTSNGEGDDDNTEVASQQETNPVVIVKRD